MTNESNDIYSEDIKLERAKNNYISLVYFFENNLMVHFSTYDSGWKNGTILKLDKDSLSITIEERLEGIKSYPLHNIVTRSIDVFKERVK
jgi:hypothetical protein